MLELQRRGYGQEKAIPSIEMAATGIDSVLAIVGAPGRRQAGCRSQHAGVYHAGTRVWVCRSWWQRVLWVMDRDHSMQQRARPCKLRSCCARFPAARCTLLRGLWKRRGRGVWGVRRVCNSERHCHPQRQRHHDQAARAADHPVWHRCGARRRRAVQVRPAGAPHPALLGQHEQPTGSWRCSRVSVLAACWGR